MNIVKSLGKTEQFIHYLTTAGTIIAVPVKTKTSRLQSMSMAIQLAKEAK